VLYLSTPSIQNRTNSAVLSRLSGLRQQLIVSLVLDLDLNIFVLSPIRSFTKSCLLFSASLLLLRSALPSFPFFFFFIRAEFFTSFSGFSFTLLRPYAFTDTLLAGKVEVCLDGDRFPVF
jgi:hypothetical protein